MKVYKHRENIAAATLADKEVLSLKLNTNHTITLAMLATGANIRIKVEYIFDAKEGCSHAASGGGSQTVTDCSAASSGGVFVSAAHGYVVGDIVSVRGQRSPDPAIASTYLSGYEVERGAITAVATNNFTIAEHNTASAGSFAGTGYAVYEGHKALISTHDLTADTLTIVNFDYKLGKLVITRGETGSTAAAGILRIDATASG